MCGRTGGGSGKRSEKRLSAYREGDIQIKWSESGTIRGECETKPIVDAAPRPTPPHSTAARPVAPLCPRFEPQQLESRPDERAARHPAVVGLVVGAYRSASAAISIRTGGPSEIGRQPAALQRPSTGMAVVFLLEERGTERPQPLFPFRRVSARTYLPVRARVAYGCAALDDCVTIHVHVHVLVSRLGVV